MTPPPTVAIMTIGRTVPQRVEIRKDLIRLYLWPKADNLYPVKVCVVYLDRADLLTRSMPSLVPPSASDWPVWQKPSFVTDLGRAMGATALHWGQPGSTGEISVPAFWQDLILLEHCPRSQYDALRETISKAGGVPGNIACLALRGQGFHGQHARRWAVEAGNLHLSMAIACDLPVEKFAPVMPALPAMAVVDAIAALGQGQLLPGIKWVNDVLLHGKKVAGSLTALRTERGRITAVILGVGLNVATAPQLLHNSLAAEPRALATTSLRAELFTGTPTLTQVLMAMLTAVSKRFNQLVELGPDALLADYRRSSLVMERQVTIWSDAGDAFDGGQARPLIRGEVVGIGPDLSLVLAGRSEPVTSGRVELPPPTDSRTL